jgi:hypothetical protein
VKPHLIRRGDCEKTNLEGSLASHDNTEARGCSETFLRGRNNDINAPIVEPDFFASNGADTIKDNLSAQWLQLDIHQHNI